MTDDGIIYYRSFNSYMRERFGEKVYKLSLDGGFTCPNRDGTIGSKGCIFCLDGSSQFSIRCDADNVDDALEKAKLVVGEKAGNKFIAYFQSYSGTYGTKEKVSSLYESVAARDDIAAISIGTRPDCLSDEIIEILCNINRKKPVFIELGLQTIHEKTAAYIRRGYELGTFDDAVHRLHEAGIETVVHMIIGLPGESVEMMAQTASYIKQSGANGIKFQLLHVLRGTDLADDYNNGSFEVLSLEQYIAALKKCVAAAGEEIVVHRLTGDGAKKDLIAPLWSADKKMVLNKIHKEIRPLDERR